MNWSQVAEQNRRLLLPRRIEVLGLVDTEDSDVCMSVDEFFSWWSEKGYAPFQQCKLLLIDGTVEFFMYAWTGNEGQKLIKTTAGAVLFAS